MSRKIFAWIKKDWLTKILSIFFAIILWTYVMAVENPLVDKQVNGVPVRFAAEDELISKNLIVRGDRSKALSKVDVVVNVERSYYSSVTSDTLSATVSLANIVSPGSYTLRINTTPTRGRHISTSPSTVTLEVDQLTTKTVPVRLEMQGTLPDGYWADKAELTPSAVQISGALDDITRVRQGVCVVNLDGLTRSYNDTLRVELRDENDEVIDNAILLGDQPSIIVKMDVLHKKTVGFDMDSAIVGSDKLPKGFEINHVRVFPTSMEVVGEADVLEGLQKLTLEALNIQNATESVLAKVKIKPPEGVMLLGSDEVELFVDISEQTRTADLNAVPIELTGLGKGLTATLDETHADVVATGRVSLIDRLTRADVKLTVDITGLPEGEHKLDIKTRITPKELEELTLTVFPESVTVVIKKK